MAHDAFWSVTPETVFSVMSEEQIKARLGRSLRIAQAFFPTDFCIQMLCCWEFYSNDPLGYFNYSLKGVFVFVLLCRKAEP